MIGHSKIPEDVVFHDGGFCYADEQGRPRLDGHGLAMVVTDADRLGTIVDLMIERIGDIRKALDYSLMDLPMSEKACDGRLWNANLAAHKLTDWHATSHVRRLVELEKRQAELLATIRQLGQSTPYPEEAGNTATLIAEVGTLRSKLVECERISKVRGDEVARLAHECGTAKGQRDRMRDQLDAIQKTSAKTEPRSNVTIFATYLGPWDGGPQPPQPGELAKVELPGNCSVHQMPGRTAGELVRIVSLAEQIGAHWRDQEGVNGSLLDELAEVTRP